MKRTCKQIFNVKIIQMNAKVHFDSIENGNNKIANFNVWNLIESSNKNNEKNSVFSNVKIIYGVHKNRARWCVISLNVCDFFTYSFTFLQKLCCADTWSKIARPRLKPKNNVE